MNFKKLNDDLEKYKTLIEIAGIIVAIGLLFFTAWTTNITQKNLELNQHQFLQQQMPILDFNIDNDNNTIELKLLASGFVFQQANVIYPTNIFDGQISRAVDPPDNKWHIFTLRQFLEKLYLDQNSNFKPEYYEIGNRYGFPVCIEFRYTHLGESKFVRGLYWVQFSVVRVEENEPNITFKAVHFIRYLNQNEDAQFELDKQIEVFMGNNT